MPLTRSAPSPRLLAAAGAVAGVLVLGACSSSAPSASSAPSTGSGATAPAPTPSGAGDSAPPADIGPEAQAPVAAVRRYYAALSQGTNTGELDEVRSLATAQCPCQKVVDLLRDYYAAGRTFEGYSFTVDEVRQAQVQGDAAAVRVAYSVSDYSSFQGDTKLGDTDARTGVAVIGLERTDGEWLVATVQDIAAPSAKPA